MRTEIPSPKNSQIFLKISQNKLSSCFSFSMNTQRHVAYQRKILSEGKVLSQGPIRDEATGKPSARGLFFLNVSSYEEVNISIMFYVFYVF